MYLPSTWRTATLGLAAIVVVVAVVTQRILPGIALAAVVYLVGWVIGRLSPGTPLDDMSETRVTATAVGAALVLGYSLFVTQALLWGIFVAALLVVVAWATAPAGPVASWLDAR